jgi:Mg2+ and Co2+ transporter CorA
MLDFRNDKEIVNNGENMRIIAAAAHEENKSMALLATKSQKDSRIIKVLTIITMLYLPASLVAVFVLPQALDND